MSALTEFRNHCRKMATVEHKPECPSLPANRPHWPTWAAVYGDDGELEALRWNGPRPPVPACDGCNSADDRALFARMASEVDDYLAPQVDLFGETTPEPVPPPPARVPALPDPVIPTNG